MDRIRVAIILCVCVLTLLVSVASAATAMDYGQADQSAPEYSQFEYYRGQWRTSMSLRQEDGTFKPLDFVATITLRYMADGRTVQTEFTGSGGFFSADIRAFNPNTKQWEALFLNAQAQRWHQFKASLVDGLMTTIILGGYSGKEPFDVKVVDRIIDHDRFQKDVYHSTDKMRTWEMVYQIDVTRID